MREKIKKHCSKSTLNTIVEARGITLITLIVTIVVLLILAGVATYSGIEAIDNTKRTKFIAELKIMQSHVNQWYEDCKPSVNAENYEGEFATKVQTKFTINNKAAVNVASIDPSDSEKVITAQTALTRANVPSEKYGNFYLLEETELQALDVEGVSQAVLVSIRDRKVVSYLGLKYKGNIYYTIDSIDGENGIDAIYNVGYENPNTNAPSIRITGRSIYNGETAKGAKYKFTVDVTQGSSYINKGELYYGKIENETVKNWNKTEDNSFIVDRDGTYKIYYKDAAGNMSEQIDYVIEPKAKLIDGSLFNVKMKKLSGMESPEVTTDNTNIIEFKISDVKPSTSILNDANKVSTNDSQYPVYMWYDDGTIYLWSEENWFYYPSKSFNMYRQLLGLRKINDLYKIDTRMVTTLHAFFYNDSSLVELDLSNFNTSNVEKMQSLFAGCSSLTKLDLSSFNTNKVDNTYAMFNKCTNLKTIYVSNNFVVDAVVNTSDAFAMFGYCTSLVGGAGTTYDPNHTNKAYARIDEPDNEKPGYFTQKNQ